MNCSGQALCVVIAATPVWISAASVPSGLAPSATRCSVVVRPPTIRNTPSRDSMMRTGRPLEPGCGGGEDLVIPQPFAAEPAADIGRQDPNLLLLQPEHLAPASRPSRSPSALHHGR